MHRPGLARLFGRCCAALALAFGLWGVDAVALDQGGGEIIQHATSRYGARGGQMAKRWIETLDQEQGQPERDKLTRINSFWNQNVRGVENIDLWHKEDYWATPTETLGLAAGDCKAYVIGKYVSLRKLGVPSEKLRFVYVRARVGGAQLAHMVLGYYPTPTSVPLVLDNLVGQIMPASDRPDLTPVFSFNAEGVYINGQRAAPIDRIGRWRELVQRMQAEGITLQ